MYFPIADATIHTFLNTTTEQEENLLVSNVMEIPQLPELPTWFELQRYNEFLTYHAENRTSLVFNIDQVEAILDALIDTEGTKKEVIKEWLAIFDNMLPIIL